MLAHVLTKFNTIAAKPCYLENVDKTTEGDNLLKEIKSVVGHFEERNNSKYLVGDYLTYVDFMLYELLERIQFMTDGRLFKEHRVLETYS